MKKRYSLESVSYGFATGTRKWEFTVGKETLITPCPGGQETARKVARVINGSIKRAKRIDNLCRSNVSKLVTIPA